MAAEPGQAAGRPWVRPTTGFWQTLDAAEAWQGRLAPPYRWGLPVTLPGDRVLLLPIRPRPGMPDRALASLIANQASFEVVAHLARAMGDLAAAFRPEVVVGLPTLGMVFAPGVAQALGHTRWVPLGYSRKFWYDDALATTVRSITTPGAGKTVYLDPNQRPLLAGRRTLIVDDAVSSAQTLGQTWDLLARLGADVVGAVVAMRQGTAWRQALGPARCALLAGVFDSPHLTLRDDGWWPVDATA